MMVGKAVAQVVAKLSKMLLHFPPSIMFMLHTYRSHEYTHTHTNTHTHTVSHLHTLLLHFLPPIH